MSHQDTLAALSQEVGALSTVLHDLAPAQFMERTNCPPWNLRELVVHIAASVSVRRPFRPAGSALPASAADYYRRPERATVAYRQGNVDRTQALARQVLAGASPAQWYDEVWRDTVAQLGSDEENRPILVTGVGAMRLGDWIVTRVISVAAHGLDVALTIDRQPWTTTAALAIIHPVFVDLLGTEPPTSLNWNDLAFLQAATGRRTLTAGERLLLGPLRERFPLLS